ncbi:hypothetical protein Taro_021353, partial [Colocasia esculenta]|nr:hypothetical protein [Colocasia esculenta]
MLCAFFLCFPWVARDGGAFTWHLVPCRAPWRPLWRRAACPLFSVRRHWVFFCLACLCRHRSGACFSCASAVLWRHLSPLGVWPSPPCGG